MDLSGLNTALGTVFGILALIGICNLLDCGFRTVAQNKAQQAETARFLKWGLPAAPRAPEPKNDEHLWRF